MPMVNSVLRIADVHQDALVHFVHVERLAGHVLEIPGQLAVIGPQSQRGARVQRRALGAAAYLHPGLGLRNAPVGQIQFRIVASGNPGFRAHAQHVRQSAPGIAAGLS